MKRGLIFGFLIVIVIVLITAQNRRRVKVVKNHEQGGAESVAATGTKFQSNARADDGEAKKSELEDGDGGLTNRKSDGDEQPVNGDRPAEDDQSENVDDGDEDVENDADKDSRQNEPNAGNCMMNIEIFLEDCADDSQFFRHAT